jgi:hypothetical protein
MLNQLLKEIEFLQGVKVIGLLFQKEIRLGKQLN